MSLKVAAMVPRLNPVPMLFDLCQNTGLWGGCDRNLERRPEIISRCAEVAAQCVVPMAGRKTRMTEDPELPIGRLDEPRWAVLINLLGRDEIGRDPHLQRRFVTRLVSSDAPDPGRQRLLGDPFKVSRIG